MVSCYASRHDMLLLSYYVIDIITHSHIVTLIIALRAYAWLRQAVIGLSTAVGEWVGEESMLAKADGC